MNQISLPRSQTALSGQVGEQARAGEMTSMSSGIPGVWRYLRLARRWKWLIIGSTTLALFLGLIVTLLMAPQYAASSTLEIQREGDRVVNVQGVEPEASPVDLEFYQTQYGLLRSETLAQRVATEL